MFVRVLKSASIALLVIFILYQIIVRLVRHYNKFPIPAPMVELIDNPLRRRLLHPPAQMVSRHGIQPGMTVLEVGPGKGTYTLETARQLGPQGRMVAVDIEPTIIERLQTRAQASGINNLEARVADVHALPFEDASFDAITMMATLGEIPDADRALDELRRVLKPGGVLAISEFLVDPDYQPFASLTRRMEQHQFHLKQRSGNFFSYSAQFEPVAESA